MGCGCKKAVTVGARRNERLTDAVRRIAKTENRPQVILIENGTEKTESLDCYLAGCAENGKYGTVTALVFP